MLALALNGCMYCFFAFDLTKTCVLEPSAVLCCDVFCFCLTECQDEGSTSLVFVH